MNTPSKAEIIELIESDRGTCVSIYVPRRRTDTLAQQDRILLKNLSRNAEELLLAHNWRPSDVQEFLQPVHDLMEEDLFWQEHAEALALFISPQFLRRYLLPRTLDPLVVVAHHFDVIPLLCLQQANDSFHILALSRNHVGLLHGTRYNIEKVNAEGLPENLQQALGNEISEKQSGFRNLPASVGGGGRQAIFYGQGGGPDESKDEILRYFRVIDSALHDHLRNERTPLVLAGVEYLFPLYREANTYPYLVEEGIEGNPEKASLDQLRARAWNIVEPQFRRAEQEALATYRELAGTGLTSWDLEEILSAALEGRVRVLFVNPHVQRWGTFNPATGTVSLQRIDGQDGEELLNLATVYALSHGGLVYCLDPETMPESVPIAAIFRY